MRVYDWLQSHGKTKALLLKLTGDQLYLREHLRQKIAAPNHPSSPPDRIVIPQLKLLPDGRYHEELHAYLTFACLFRLKPP